MGPTGSGKSKLAIDLASHFPIEIINADSMQVYQGLDVLTNKVPLHEQNGYSLSNPFLFLGFDTEILLLGYRSSSPFAWGYQPICGIHS